MASREPQPRRFHCAVGIGKHLFVLGGDGCSVSIPSTTVERFNVSTVIWEQPLLLHGTLPDGLCDMAVTSDGERAYFFGGRSGSYAFTFYNALYQVTPSQHLCQQLEPASSSHAPAKTSGCCMVHFKDELVLHGGWTGEGRTDDLHVFDLKKRIWSIPPTTGEKPPPLAWHTFTKIDHHRAVVFGGDNRKNILNDTYVLDMETWHWMKLNVSGAKPPARSSHATCCIAGPLTGQQHSILMVVGGLNEKYKDLGDVWLLDVDNGIWSEVILPVTIIPRDSHSAVVFGSAPSFRVVVLFGGSTSSLGDPISETTLLLLELKEGVWQVVRVVKSDELGRPNEKLKEQMKKLEISSQEATASGTEQSPREEEERTGAEMQVQVLEQRLLDSEQLVRDLTQHAWEVERRATEAENRSMENEKEKRDMETRWREAENRASEVEERLTQMEAKLSEEERRSKEMTGYVNATERRLMEERERSREMEEKWIEEERRSMDMERQLRDVEGRLKVAEEAANTFHLQLKQNQDALWVVERKEIHLAERELGRGGWATVKVAEFRGLQVAAKCLHSIIISDYNRQLFMREMSIAAMLRHPNLIQFIGATVEGEPVILTELMDTSLRAILERGPLNPAQITSISCDVARALNYLHLTKPNPILHRDVSSANVLLNHGPNQTWLAKLSDYGSANFVQLVITAGPGNPAYAAPEASNPSQQGTKMDIYSYGILLVEMATRRFPDKTTLALQIQRIQIPKLPDVIQQCIHHDLAKRPHISDVLTQLEELHT